MVFIIVIVTLNLFQGFNYEILITKIKKMLKQVANERFL